MPAPDEDPSGPVGAVMHRAMAAWDAADWDAYSAAHTPDLVVIDHRPASLGSLHGRDAYLGATRVMREMFVAANSRIVEQQALGPEGSIARALITCTDETGREVEIEFTGLTVLRDGLIDRMELFGPGQLAEATARFEALNSEAHGRD